VKNGLSIHLGKKNKPAGDNTKTPPQMAHQSAISQTLHNSRQLNATSVLTLESGSLINGRRDITFNSHGNSSSSNFEIMKIILGSRIENLPILAWLMQSKGKTKPKEMTKIDDKASRIYDLAMLDILSKINQEEFQMDGASMDEDLRAFDYRLIKGIRRYLLSSPGKTSKLTEFLETCFSSEEKFPLVRYLNEGMKTTNPFVAMLSNDTSTHVELTEIKKLKREVEKAKLILMLFRLKKTCYYLLKDSNPIIRLLSKHALHYIAWAIGEQCKQLQGSMLMELLGATSINRLLEEYMDYRNYRYSDQSPRKIKRSAIAADPKLWYWGQNDIVEVISKFPKKYIDDAHVSALKGVIAALERNIEENKSSKNYLINYKFKGKNESQKQTEEHPQRISLRQ
jgi:hypothetical protein